MTRARTLADYVAGGTTAAEFDYLDGVTSNVQTQMDAKAPIVNPTLKTTNNYDFLKGGELNSKGFPKRLFFGCSYYFTHPNVHSFDDDGGWHEVRPGSGWTKMPSTTASGSDDADVWGKMDTTTGRWTPTISGYYLASFYCFHGGGMVSAGCRMALACRRNSSGSTGGNVIGKLQQQNGGGVASMGASGSGIIQLDTDDYISLWSFHDSSNAEATNYEFGQFSIYYVGSSDL